MPFLRLITLSNFALIYFTPVQGVLLSDGCVGVRLENNEVWANCAAGIEVAWDSSAALRGNLVRDHEATPGRVSSGYGVLVHAYACGRAVMGPGNSLVRNAKAGLLVAEHPSPWVKAGVLKADHVAGADEELSVAKGTRVWVLYTESTYRAAALYYFVRVDDVAAEPRCGLVPEAAVELEQVRGAPTDLRLRAPGTSSAGPKRSNAISRSSFWAPRAVEGRSGGASSSSPAPDLPQADGGAGPSAQ